MFANRVFSGGIPMGSLLRRIAATALVFPLFLSVQALAQAKLDKVRIGYAARAVAHSVPFVAKEAGFFAEEGIDAEIVRTAGSIAPMALVANEVDLAIMSAYLMIPVATQNKDVVMLGGFSRYASMVFVARPDVKSAQDLKGKIVGIQRPGRCLRKKRALRLAPLGVGCRQGYQDARARQQRCHVERAPDRSESQRPSFAAGDSVRAQGRDELHGRSDRSQTGISRLDDRDPAFLYSKESPVGDARAARDRARRASVQNTQRRHDAHPGKISRHQGSRGAWKNPGTTRRRCRRSLMRWRARCRPCWNI